MAPSFSGKTQTAFAIQSKLPLYFVFGESQAIYQPFGQLSQYIFELANHDVENLKKYFVDMKQWPNPSKQSPQTHYSITLQDLNAPFVKSKTLGLIRALFEEAEAFELDPTKNRDDWMYHFSRTRNISYEPITIKDYIRETVSKNYDKKYCVFLDEFRSSDELVFIRNLIRRLRTTCIVASTNSNVANLIGSSPTSSSRGEGPVAWSVVFDSMGPFMPETLHTNEVFKEAKESLIRKAVNSSEKDGTKMKKFFNYLEDQCISSRPGFSQMIIESIDNLANETFKNSSQVQFDDSFEKLVSTLYYAI